MATGAPQARSGATLCGKQKVARLRCASLAMTFRKVNWKIMVYDIAQRNSLYHELRNFQLPVIERGHERVDDVGIELHAGFLHDQVPRFVR